MALLEANPLNEILDAAIQSTNQSDNIPDIIKFVYSEDYLDRPTLYPRQATILKLIFLREDLMTDYDYEVIASWTEEFHLPPEEKWNPAEPLRYEGNHGMPPDVLKRLHMVKQTLIGGQPARWFREIVAAIGRRGGKGHIGALCGAYIIWAYSCLANPQKYYGVDRDKTLACYVFAGKREQAKANQWRDLVNVILGAPCFSENRRIGRSLNELLTVRTQGDNNRLDERKKRGVRSDMDISTFEIAPRESTLMAGRGPAAFMLYFDEMAHVSSSVAKNSAEEVYGSAKPALDQFGPDAFIYEGSSTWQMMGQFYENYLHGLEVYHPDSAEVRSGHAAPFDPVYPEILVMQLCSWDPYEDWQRATEIPLVPREYALKLATPEYDEDGNLIREADFFYLPQGIDGPVRTVREDPIIRPVQEYDDQMRKEERANPETFNVERRSFWATAQDAYLNPQHVDEMFLPWPDPEGQPLSQKRRGEFQIAYVAHGDPSEVGDNFGWVIGHATDPDDRGLRHVVLDRVHAWIPSEFKGARIDYEQIKQEICQDLDGFTPGIVSFDQFAGPMFKASLRTHVQRANYHRRVDIEERTSTRQLNWQVAECFKAALNMGLVHAPPHELFELECKFLQDKGGKVDHPDSGPIQSKDVFDAASNVVWTLIGDQMLAYVSESLSNFEPGLGMQGGMMGQGRPEDGQDREVFDQLSSFARQRNIREGPPPGIPTRGRGWTSRRGF